MFMLTIYMHGIFVEKVRNGVAAAGTVVSTVNIFNPRQTNGIKLRYLKVAFFYFLFIQEW